MASQYTDETKQDPTPEDNAIFLPASSARPTLAPQQFSAKRAYLGTFAGMFATRCAGVITGVLAARFLGPTGRGELAVIIFFPMLLIPLAEFELPRSIAYAISKQEQRPEELMATGFWLAIGLGCLQAVLLALALPHLLPAGKLYLLGTSRWFVVYLPAVYITLFLTGVDQGTGRFGRFGIFQALPGVSYLIAVLIACVVGATSPSAFAFAMLYGSLATAALRVMVDGRVILCSKPHWRAASIIFRRGISFYVPAVAGLFLMRADLFLLVRLTPPEAIGLYAVAQAVAWGQIGAVSPFGQVIFAAVTHKASQQDALQTLARHFRLAQLAALSVGLIAAGLTRWAIPLVFGAKFSAAETAAYLLIGATVLWGMSQVLEQGLRAVSHPGPGIVSNLLGLCVLFSLGIPACTRFGINGMAASLMAAEFANLSVLMAFCMVMLKVPFGFLWGLKPAALREFAISARLIPVRRFRTGLSASDISCCS